MEGFAVFLKRSAVPRGDLLILVLLGLATFLVYSNGITGEFLYDDSPYVTKNPQVTGEAPIFSESTPAGRPYLGLYRPVFVLTLRVNYLMAGLKPSTFHGTNILIHFLVVAALYFLIKRTAADRGGAFLGALFFAVHPVHVEAVSWIVGRAELLSFLFCLLAALLHFAAWKRPWLRLPEGLCFVLAVLSKENALAFPLVLWTLEALAPPEGRPKGFRALWKGYGVYVVLMVGVLLLRFQVLDRLSPARETAPFRDVGLFGRGEAALACLAEYLRLFILPYGLKIFYHISEIRFLTLWRMVLLVAFAALILVAVRKKKAWAAWLIWIPASLLPVLNLVPIGAVFAERFAYLPSAGACAAAGLALMALIRREGIRRDTHLAVWIPTALVLCFGILTYARNPVFNDSFHLWKDAVRKGNAFAFPHYNLGECYFERGIMDPVSGETWGAAAEFKESLRLNPDHPYAFSAHYRLGQYYINRHRMKGGLGDLREARAQLESSVRKAPPLHEMSWKPALLLAQIPLERGGDSLVSPEQALAYLAKAEQLGASHEITLPLRVRLEEFLEEKKEQAP